MKFSRFSIALSAVICVIAAGCFGGGDSSDDTTPPTEIVTTTEAVTTTTAPPSTTVPPTTTAPPSTIPPSDCKLDINGDNMVRVGVAIPGSRNNGSYYQALVEFVEKFSDDNSEANSDNCFVDPIVVENIQESTAAAELDALAQQNVDIIAVGASYIADPLPKLTEQYSNIFWYCNCGAGAEPIDNLAQSHDDSSEINYTAGYATGLLLQATGGNSAAFIGCCDLSFEQEAYISFEMGLKAVDPGFSMTYAPILSFNDVSGASDALTTAIQNGADAVYPLLSERATSALAEIANRNGVIVMSDAISNVCESTETDYDIAIRSDNSNYLDTIFNEILSGRFTEGEVRVFRVGQDEEPGAVICDPTDAQQEAMTAIYRQIGAGDFAEAFDDIKKQVYPASPSAS